MCKKLNIFRHTFMFVVIVVLTVGLFIVSNTSTYAKVKKNENDVRALKKIIEVQVKKGANINTNLNDKSVYRWGKKNGRLIRIDWSV